MSDAITTSRWPARFAGTTFWAGIGAALAALVGSYGTGFGFWDFRVGFLFIGAALLLALIAVLAGLIAVIRKARTGRVWLGLIAALGFLGVMGFWFNKGASNPPIHDVTTNLANPPAFQKLSLRADNLAGVETVEKWRELHAGAFGDIQPVTLTSDPAATVKKAEKIVRARGWDVALVAPDRIEATDTVSPFRFKDDVVITVAPGADGKGSVVNIRSVSRVGISDLGLNAERVRALIADLKA